MKFNHFIALAFLATTLLLPAAAQDLEARIAELEATVDALTRVQEQQTLGALGGNSSIGRPVGESVHGLGPAASKVYAGDGLSIGGYGEARYRNREDDSDEADFLRGVLYVGYKYSDKWVFNSEIEFEHASTSKEGSASVEFAAIDYLHSDALNLRAGILLVPMGHINKLHEPTTFLSTQRPETERRIIPSTWRENGAGIFGDLGDFAYEAYVVNGLKGENFDDNGFRGGRQKGSEAVADDLGFVGRVDYTGQPGLLIGASAYQGDSGQDSGLSLDTTIVEGHVDWQRNGFRVRGLAASGQLSGAAELNARRAEQADTTVAEINSVGEDLFGWYAELGYDVLNRADFGEASLTPFIRYEELNTVDSIPGDGSQLAGKRDREAVTVGVAFQPLDELIFKADYIINDAASGDPGNSFNLGIGYVF